MELFKLFGRIAIDSDEANKDIKKTTDNAEDSSDKITDAFKKIGGAVTAFFAIDKIKDFGAKCVNIADSSKSAINDFAASTGTATDELQGYEDVMHSIYKNNFGESFEDVANSMATIKQQAGDIGQKELEELTTNAIMLRDTFEFEVNESFRAAKMLSDQFGISGEQAYNLIAQGAQNGLDKNGDLLDSINEYSVHYSQLGMTAEEFFNSLANGTDAGTFSVDKLGDAMKEFGIRVKDGSDASKTAFSTIGLDATEMTKKFNEGGESAKEAFDKTVKALLSMDDPVQQNIQGVALFGTMWEDLGVEGIAALTNLEGGISTTKDSLSQINEIKYDSLGSALGGLGRSIETNILMPIGEKMIPFVSSAIEKLNAFGQWCTENETTLTIIGIAVGTFAAALAAYNIVQNATAICTAISTAATTAFGAALAFVTSPITLVVVAIGALIAIGVLLYKNWDTIKEKCLEVWNSIKDFFSNLWKTIKNNVVNAWNGIKEWISNLWNSLKEKCSNVWNSIKTGISNVMNGIKNVISSIWNGIKNTVSTVVNAIKTTVSNIWNGIKTTISNVMNGIKTTISNIWNGIKTTISTVVNGVKSTVSNVFNGIKTVATNVWNGIKSAITNPIETARNTISGIVEKIKGIFSGLKLKLPDIKMPHFSIKPSGWKIGDLLKGSIPKLGIDWYAKAMNNAMLLDKPTIFGYDSNSGNLMGGGEAGTEVVAGSNTLMGMIQKAVATQNSDLIAVLVKILNAILLMNDEMGGNLREALENLSLKVGEREFARIVRAVI